MNKPEKFKKDSFTHRQLEDFQKWSIVEIIHRIIRCVIHPIYTG
jgi:hypothetical protein